MKKNIEDYVFHKSGFLDSHFCKNAVVSLEETEWDKHTFLEYASKDDGSMITWAASPAKELEPSYKDGVSNLTSDIVLLNDFIIKELYDLIQEYVDFIGFEWFNSWAGYMPIKFIRYSLNEKMVEHWDAIRTMFDGERKGIPILSVIGTLNDDYEGGELILFRDKKIDMKAGDLLIFPSSFMYPHKIDPVKKGSRYSYVSWIW